MARKRFTSQAFRDLEAILQYVKKKDPIAALRLANRLEADVTRLSQNPGIGQPRPKLGADIRFLPARNYLIFYRALRDGVQIIRILHGSRNYDATDF